MENAGDFARELLAALARGDAARTGALAEQQLAASADPNARIEFAEQSWSAAGAPELLVFENVEHILGSVDNMELLARILSRTPESRRVAICSRRPLPLSLTRFAPPHEIITLRAEDLRFNAGEIEQALAGTGLAADALHRIAELTRGWPIAVLLFARLARENALPAIFEDLGTLRFDEMYEYLAEQVLSWLPPPQFKQLIALAVIPRATAEEVAVATGDPSAVETVAAFARSSPLVYNTGDRFYEVHPLVAEMLRERYSGECAKMLRHTADTLRTSDQLRAAQLYLHANDQDAAASMLEDATSLWLSDAPPKFAEVVAQLDPNVLLRYPAVWSSATPVRSTAIPHAQWLHEALVVRDNLSANSPLGVQIGVLASLSNVLSNVGRHDEALDILRHLAAAHPQLPPSARGIIDLYEGGIGARKGAFSHALSAWDRARPIFAEVNFTRAIGIEEVDVRVARYRGDRIAERAAAELAVSLAKESGVALGIALTLEEAAFGAWFAGEDALFRQYAAELESAVVPTTRKGTEVFRACSRGDVDPLRRSQGIEHPKIRCYAALIACGAAPSDARSEIARLALLAAKESGEPPLVVMSCIALAECDPSVRDEMVKGAKAAASLIEYGELAQAVAAYAAGDSDCGMLAPLVARIHDEAPVTVRESEPKYCVFVWTARVFRDDREVSLSGRELELMLYLAARNRACTRQEIIDALWPERAMDESTVLRVSLNRTRKRLDDQDVIISSRRSYQLGPHVTSDVAEMERALRLARQNWPLSRTCRLRLQQCFERFCTAAAAEEDWPWFGPAVVRLAQLIREIATLLSRDALESGEYFRARRFAMRIVEHDPCDEPARELVIRTYLETGDRSSAIREYRNYRDALAEELGAQPSTQIRELVGE